MWEESKVTEINPTSIDWRLTKSRLCETGCREAHRVTMAPSAAWQNEPKVAFRGLAPSLEDGRQLQSKTNINIFLPKGDNESLLCDLAFT